MRQNIIEIFLKKKRNQDLIANSEESVWNLFVQILLPLILILTFMSVMLILKYKDKADQAQKDIEGVIDYATGLEGQYDPAKTRRGAQKLILRLQMQKLLKAFLEVEKTERESLRLNSYRTAGDVKLKGAKLDDEDFKKFCLNFRNTILDSRNLWNNEYLKKLYSDILVKANVKDNDISSLSFLIIDLRGDPEYGIIERSRAAEGIILETNRKIIASKIVTLVNSFEKETENLQKNVILHIIEAMIDNPEELDEESRKLIDKLIKGEDTENTVARFYAKAMSTIKDDIRNYNFLPGAVNEISSMYSNTITE